MSFLRFPLGSVVATPSAMELLERRGANARGFLVRHQQGDWGDLVQENAIMSDHAAENGERTFSAYVLGNERAWIITE